MGVDPLNGNNNGETKKDNKFPTYNNQTPKFPNDNDNRVFPINASFPKFNDNDGLNDGRNSGKFQKIEFNAKYRI